VISVVVRAKNEERWIGRCLAALQEQDCPGFEIVVVDNESVDNTRRLVKQFGCRLVTISEREFSHGRSLNVGISAAQGDLVAVLSGHCIPAHDKWLRRLALAFTEPRIAGVYGRQEPLPDTSDLDKRDLWTAFGLERRVQTQDYFFHNANSMIRREVWEKVPFNESLSGVEDREWAKRVLELGYQIIYEPAACVYHFHGINHGQDEARAARVVRVIELIKNGGVRGGESRDG
jgi:glycosyltransferase involved in cell wall biosynthesis